jgi:hypothetical protein
LPSVKSLPTLATTKALPWRTVLGFGSIDTASAYLYIPNLVYLPKIMLYYYKKTKSKRM